MRGSLHHYVPCTTSVVKTFTALSSLVGNLHLKRCRDGNWKGKEGNVGRNEGREREVGRLEYYRREQL